MTPSDLSGTPSEDVLLVETSEHIRTLTLNRPRSRNALSIELRRRIVEALSDAEADPEVAVVILTASDPVFCAGVDLKELAGRSGTGDSSAPWRSMTKPVIGAINGAAVTGGLELALCCDILIASENARFADTHARVGLLPIWGLSVRLPQAVGRSVARRMSLTGDYLSASDALRVGLVTEVVPHDQLLATARGVAATIAGNNTHAVQALVASYHRIDESEDREGLSLEADAARSWMAQRRGSDVAVDTAAVMERGREQLR